MLPLDCDYYTQRQAWKVQEPFQTYVACCVASMTGSKFKERTSWMVIGTALRDMAWQDITPYSLASHSGSSSWSRCQDDWWSAQTQSKVWTCHSGAGENHMPGLVKQPKSCSLGHATWVMTKNCQRGCILWKESEPSLTPEDTETNFTAPFFNSQNQTQI